MKLKIKISKPTLLYYAFTLYVCFVFANNELFSENVICKNYFIVIPLVLAMFFFRVRRSMVGISWYVMVNVFLIVLALCSFIWTPYKLYFYQIPTCMICNIIAFIAMDEISHYIPVNRILNSFILAGIVASLKLVLFVPKESYGWDVEFEYMGNRNVVGLCLSFSAALCFFMFRFTKKYYYIAIMTWLYYAVFLAGSKKGVLFGIIIIVINLFFTKGFSKKFRQFILVLLCVLIVWYVLNNNEYIYNLIGSRFDLMNNYFRGRGYDNSSEERMFLIRYAFEMFTEKPFFGWGINGVAGKLSLTRVHRIAYSHCNYTELLADFGLVGFIIYYSTFFVQFKRWKNKRLLYNNHLNESVWTLGMSIIIALLVVDIAAVTFSEITVQLFLILAIVLISYYRAEDFNYEFVTSIQ